MYNETHIKEKMATILRKPVSKLKNRARLADLVTDSFGAVELIIELQDELGVRFIQEDFKNVKTVGDLIRLIQSGGARSGHPCNEMVLSNTRPRNSLYMRPQPGGK